MKTMTKVITIIMMLAVSFSASATKLTITPRTSDSWQIHSNQSPIMESGDQWLSSETAEATDMEATTTTAYTAWFATPQYEGADEVYSIASRFIPAGELVEMSPIDVINDPRYAEAGNIEMVLRVEFVQHDPASACVIFRMEGVDTICRTGNAVEEVVISTSLNNTLKLEINMGAHVMTGSSKVIIDFDVYLPAMDLPVLSEEPIIAEDNRFIDDGDHDHAIYGH